MICQCSCGERNLIHHDYCDRCGSLKPLPPKPKPPSDDGRIDFRSLLPMMTVKPMKILSTVIWLIYREKVKDWREGKGRHISEAWKRYDT